MRNFNVFVNGSHNEFNVLGFVFNIKASTYKEAIEVLKRHLGTTLNTHTLTKIKSISEIQNFLNKNNMLYHGNIGSNPRMIVVRTQLCSNVSRVYIISESIVINE